MTEKDLFKSYRIWLRNYKYQEADQSISHDLYLPGVAPDKGGLKTAREALLLSTGKVANTMKISGSGYTQIESSEMKGTISLNSLRKAAEAMDCELIYTIRPKKGILFSQVIYQQLLARALRTARVLNARPLQKVLVIGATAKDAMKNAKFRKRQGWTKRKN